MTHFVVMDWGFEIEVLGARGQPKMDQGKIYQAFLFCHFCAFLMIFQSITLACYTLRAKKRITLPNLPKNHLLHGTKNSKPNFRVPNPSLTSGGAL